MEYLRISEEQLGSFTSLETNQTVYLGISQSEAGRYLGVSKTWGVKILDALNITAPRHMELGSQVYHYYDPVDIEAARIVYTTYPPVRGKSWNPPEEAFAQARAQVLAMRFGESPL